MLGISSLVSAAAREEIQMKDMNRSWNNCHCQLMTSRQLLVGYCLESRE